MMVTEGLFDHAIVVQQILYIGLMLIGMARLWRSAWPWMLAIGIHVMAYVTLVAQTRYLVPVTPLILTFAAIALARMLWPHDERIARAVNP